MTKNGEWVKVIRFIDRKMIYRIANDNTQEEINRELREIDCRDDKDQVIIFRNNQNKLSVIIPIERIGKETQEEKL